MRKESEYGRTIPGAEEIFMTGTGTGGMASAAREEAFKVKNILQPDINACEAKQMIASDEAGKLRKQYSGLEKPKYHEINDMIKIDFKIPEALGYLMEEAEKADIRNDGSYDNLADTIDVMSKNCYAAGKITAAQWDTIARRYPQ